MVIHAPHTGVTVDIRDGLPSLTVVGYPDRTSIAVARELRAIGDLPAQRVTVQLTPTRKRANPSDQAIAHYVSSALRHAGVVPHAGQRFPDLFEVAP